MAIDIENPGGLEAALRAALEILALPTGGNDGDVLTISAGEKAWAAPSGGGGASGWEFISTGTIVDDTAILLPSGYAVYEMLLLGLNVDSDGIYSMRASLDGGATYFEGASDYNSAPITQFISPDNFAFDQGFLIRNPALQAGIPTNLKLTILPGSSTAFCSVETTGIITNSGVTQPIHNGFTTGQFTTPVNAIKFKPFWGDARVTTAGEYRLLGLA